MMRWMKRVVYLVLLIVALGAGILLWWLSSPSFDRFVAERVQRELAKLNIRAQIGQVEARPFDLAVDIRNLRLFAGDESVPFFEMAGLEAELKILDLFSRQFELHRLKLKQPTVSVVFDEQGRSNLSAIDLTPLKKERPEGTQDIRIGHISIEGGTVVYNHRPNHTSGEARNLEIIIQPETESARITVNARDTHVSFNDRRFDDLSFEIKTAVSRKGADIERARIVTPFIDAVLNGAMRRWSRPEYDLNVASTLDLSGLSREVDLGVSLKGDAELHGRITGEAASWNIEGNAVSSKMTVGGVQLAAFRFDMEGGTTGSELAAAGATPPTNDSTAFWLQGLLRLDRILPGLIWLRDFHSPVLITAEQMTLKSFFAATLKGAVTGSAVVSFHGGSSATADFRSIDFHEAAALVGGREYPVAGSVRGQCRFTWPATRFNQIAGTARVTIDSVRSETNIPWLPSSGTLAARVDRHAIVITDSDLKIGAAQARVTGRVTWKKDFDLHIETQSSDLAEAEKFLAVLDINLNRLTRGAVERLSGTGAFSGRIEKTSRRVSLSGIGTINNLALSDGRITTARSHIEYGDGVVMLTDGAVSLADGSQVQLARLRYELDVENGLSLQGTMRGLNVQPWADRFGLALPLTGRATGEFSLTGLPGALEGQTTFTLADGAMDLFEFSGHFDRITGQIIANRSQYDWRDVRVQFGDSLVALSGTYRPQTQAYSIRAEGRNLDLSRFDAALEEQNLPLGGRLSFDLAGEGTLAEPQFDGHGQIAQLTISGTEAGTIAGEVHSARGNIKWQITARLFGQEQLITGGLDLNDPAQPLTLRGELNQFQLRPYLKLFMEVPAEWSYLVSGRIDLEWPLVFPERQRLVANLSHFEAKLGDYVVKNETPLAVNITGNRITVADVQLSGENTNVKVGGAIDLGTAADWKQGRADFSIEGSVDLRIVRAFYPDLFTTGLATIRATARGTLNQPRLSGIADVENVSARLLDFPVALSGGGGRIRFTEDKVLLERFTGTANEGEVRVDGGLFLKGLAPDRWRFNIIPEGTVVRYPQGWRSVLGGELTLQGTRQLQLLSGILTVRRAEYTQDIDLAEVLLRQASVFQKGVEIKKPTGIPLSLDIRVQAADSIYVNNNFAEAQASAWLRVTGTLDEPLISGRATATNGTLELRERKYQITTAAFDFPGRRGEPLRLNLEAETDISGYRVILGFAGPLDKLKPTLRSEPPLSPGEVISLIATSRTDTVTQEAQALAQTNLGIADSLLAETLSHQLQQKVTRFFGINRFQLEPLLFGQGSEPTARVTVGRQITKELSITYTFDVTSSQRQAVILEYRLSDRFSLVAARDELEKFSIDFRIRQRR
jgi:translocation and assembly module TamB